VELMFECSLVQITGHANVECAGDAAHDVNAIRSSSAHAGIGVLRLREKFALRTLHYAQDDSLRRTEEF
jgi:hypothetical protein